MMCFAVVLPRSALLSFHAASLSYLDLCHSFDRDARLIPSSAQQCDA